MKILGVCGSLQAKSSNLSLLHKVAELAPAGVDFVLYQRLGDLPHFNPDLEGEAISPAVTDWRHQLTESDAVLIASPDYGHSLPGSLKNAIDWVIGTGELERKIVAVTAATVSPERGRMGLNALLGTLGAVSARIVGGEPIARGPDFDKGVEHLLRALVDAVAADANPENPAAALRA